MQMVCFFLGEQEFAVQIDDVRETIGLRPISAVFRTPPPIAGIFSLRGEILVALDPALLLGLPQVAMGDDTRIVIVDTAVASAGLLADRLGSIREVASDAVSPVPSTVPPSVSAMLSGVVSLAERPVGVLDATRLLTAPVLRPFTLAKGGEPPTASAAGRP